MKLTYITSVSIPSLSAQSKQIMANAITMNNLIRNFDKSKDMYLNTSDSLLKSASNIIDSKINSLQLQSGMLDVLSYNSVLKRGFAVIKDKNSKIVTNSKKLKVKDELMINFYKNDKIKVILKKDK